MPEILSFLSTNNNSSDFLSGQVTFFGCILIKTLNFSRFFSGINNFSKAEKYSRITMCDHHLRKLTTTAVSIQSGLQNSPYFCVFKYARAVKRKVWNEAENREQDWGETLISLASQALWACEARALRARKTVTPLLTDFFTDFEKKTDRFAVLDTV